jgi:DNA processing protein
VYPANNRSLLLDTQRYGCLLSEFPPGTPPYKWNFPKRNRIISGLSCGVAVVEAPKRSGALITANLAAEQGRDVFAVPGNIDVETFVGCNNLLDDGAYMARSGWDVVRQYAHMYPGAVTKYTGQAVMTAYPDETEKQDIPEAKVAQKPTLPRKEPLKEKKVIDKEDSSAYSDGKKDLPKLNPEEQKLYDLLEEEMLVDDLIAASGMATARVLAMLTMLQVRGVVQTLPGRRIRRKK